MYNYLCGGIIGKNSICMSFEMQGCCNTFLLHIGSQLCFIFLNSLAAIVSSFSIMVNQSGVRKPAKLEE